MKIQVKKLRDTMVLLAPVIPKKTQLSSLRYFLLEGGKITATDLEMRVSLELPEARETLLLHKEAEEFLRFIPGDTMAEITREKAGVTISCGASRSTFPTEDPGDYPSEPKSPGIQVHMDGDRLIQALSMAVDYAATETDRPVLNGVSLLMEEQGAWVCAGDGFRMLLKEVPGTFSTPATVIIPVKTVKVLEVLWKKIPHAVNPAVDALLAELALSKRLLALGFAEGLMSARFGPVAITSQLTQGSPPNFRQLIPTDPPKKVHVYAPDFYGALCQIKDVAKEGSKIVRLVWSGDTMKISATGEDRKAETEVKVSIEGGEGRTAVGSHYLLEYLKDKQGMVEIGVSNPQSPIRFLDGRYQVVIMPMFVQWDDQPKPESSPVATVEAEGDSEEVEPVDEEVEAAVGTEANPEE